ncbi:MAG: acyl-ACP--UDP-N-acetylglucosamine O-acyltransferase [Planctomycetota bacterium]|jgi:UDP-N-acetylglucosamine acyltransferase|nr:acyl-ACP--UDP-N-acetylglucosamine O-acyltransferase [Planctomycetota bacterium]
MIHSTAIIEKGAKLADDVEVGPFCYVGPNVDIGPGNKLINSVTILGRTTIGERNRFHPFSVIGGDPQDLKYRGENSETIIGNNNIFRENCTVNKGTEVGGGRTVIGSQNYLMACSHIAHDTIIEDHCILANTCLLAGHIKIEKWAILSGNVMVHHFVTVGQHAFIGGMSRINQDTPPFMICQGLNGEIRGLNSVGLRRRGFSDESINLLRDAHRKIWRSDGPTSEVLTQIETESGSNKEIQTLLNFLRASGKGKMGRAREGGENGSTNEPQPEANLSE